MEGRLGENVHHLALLPNHSRFSGHGSLVCILFYYRKFILYVYIYSRINNNCWYRKAEPTIANRYNELLVPPEYQSMGTDLIGMYHKTVEYP